MNTIHHDVSMTHSEQQIIQCALQILYTHQKSVGVLFDSDQYVIDFLRLKFGLCEREIFSVFFLDTQMRLIEFEELFYGTVNQTAIFPREIAKRALRLNASHVILAHNHPSGWVSPSEADRKATVELQDALKLVGVNVMDHIIIGVNAHLSFARAGLL